MRFSSKPRCDMTTGMLDFYGIRLEPIRDITSDDQVHIRKTQAVGDIYRLGFRYWRVIDKVCPFVYQVRPYKTWVFRSTGETSL